MRVELSGPQFDFVEAGEQFPALIAGFGAGKTHAGIWRLLTKKLAYPKQNVAYYLPTYDLVARTGIPRFEETLENVRLPFKTNKNEALIEIERCGQIIFRTMDNPARIVAYEVADSIADELDTLPTEKAREVWNKIIGRNRQKKPDGSLNTVGVVTTPEGFRFVYDRWKKNAAPGYRLIKATTQSNAKHLPVGYIESLQASYPTNLLAAYLDGEFVNLTSGSVYTEFDRALNATSDMVKPDDALHIGMDFNVGQMAAVVCVVRDWKPRAVAELSKLLDTPAMIAAIKARYPGHSIFVYPDASGGNRKSNNASLSDISLLEAAGFTVLNNPSNPAVKDRVLSVQQALHSAGERKLLVNGERCPGLVEGLEKQAYDKNGEPDKTAGLDHLLDALGYFIAYRYPVAQRVSAVSTLRL
jgi:hypothetical protein